MNGAEATTTEQKGMVRPRPRAVLALLAFGGVLALAARLYRAPDPAPVTAPTVAFSADRAFAVLTRILGDEAPHPLGSAANAEVRARIAYELAAIGLTVEVQEQLVAHPRGNVARVHNLLARIDGERDGPALLLAAHHDSVGAGPGACDDGAAVAAMIETARALVTQPRLQHPVILLIDDGEELGLFGARAFCQHHRWAKDVAAVLNFEARGTSGPSLMFETAGDDAWLVDAAARALDRPMTGSAFATVYRSLPNSTDLAVFREHGLPGLNFAFVGDVRRYHTPRDELKHVDRRSLQHHGEQMLALARELGHGPLPGRATGSALFFDVLGRFVVALPRAWELPLSGLVLLAHVLAAAVLLGRRLVTRAAVGRGVALVPLAATLAAGAGLGLALLLDAMGTLPTPFPVDAVSPGLAFFLAGTALFLGVQRIFAAKASALGTLVGVGTFAALTAIALASAAPGSSPPFLVPATASAVGLLLAMFGRGGPGCVAGLSLAIAIVAAISLAPLFVFLPATVGAKLGSIHTVFAVCALGWLAAPLAILLHGRLGRAAVVSTLACAGALVLCATPESERHDLPVPSNIVYTQLAGKEPLWAFGDTRTPPTPRGSFAFRRALPWTDEEACYAAEDLGLDPPEGRILSRESSRGRTIVRIAARSPRGSPWINLLVPSGYTLHAATIAGVKVEKLAARSVGRSSWRTLAFLGAEPDEEIEFVLTLSGTSRDVFHVTDRTLGLPPAGRAMARTRDASGHAQIHMGDGVILAAPVSR